MPDVPQVTGDWVIPSDWKHERAIEFVESFLSAKRKGLVMGSLIVQRPDGTLHRVTNPEEFLRDLKRLIGPGYHPSVLLPPPKPKAPPIPLPQKKGSTLPIPLTHKDDRSPRWVWGPQANPMWPYPPRPISSGSSEGTSGATEPADTPPKPSSDEPSAEMKRWKKEYDLNSM